MTAPQDTGSRTEADAAAFERRFGPDYDADRRPTRAELDRDEHDGTDEEPPTCPGCGDVAGHRGVCR